MSDESRKPEGPLDEGLRKLDAVHLPATEADDPRLAIPEELRKPIARPHALGGQRAAKGEGSANDLMRISTVGTNFALAVVVLGLAGWALQKWLWPSAAPWLLVGGLLLGLVVGMVRFVHDAKALMK